MFTNKGLKCYASEPDKDLKDYIREIEEFRDEKKKEYGDQWNDDDD